MLPPLKEISLGGILMLLWALVCIVSILLAFVAHHLTNVSLKWVRFGNISRLPPLAFIGIMTSLLTPSTGNM